jgi:hypothetical protein
MKRNLLAAVIIASWCASAIVVQASQARKQVPVGNLLERKVVGVSDYHDVQSALIAALTSSGVPGGLAKVEGCEREAAVPIARIPTGTLRSALDAIVGGDPWYRWELDGGVVNVLPVSGEPPLLSTRIAAFSVRGAPSVDAEAGRLLDLTEVRREIVRLHLSEATRFVLGSVPLSSHPPSYSVDCAGVTVRQALNAIVRAHGRAVWEYKERHCGGEAVFSIDFIVQ